jgi:predicted Zn-dependent protease
MSYAVPEEPLVLTSHAMMDLGKRITEMMHADDSMVSINHVARGSTRMARGQVLSGDDGETLSITLIGRFGGKPSVTVSLNQRDDASLRAAIDRLEMLAKQQIGGEDNVLRIPEGPREYLPVSLWKERTVRAFADDRHAAVIDIVDAIRREGLIGAGFVGLQEKTQLIMRNSGLVAVCQSTDTEVTVSARGSDGKSSGWAGQAARDWADIDVGRVAASAIDLAHRTANPVAIEPGRRTAILGPTAVGQMLRTMSYAYDAFSTDGGVTPFSNRTSRRKNKLGMRVFDDRLRILSDVNDAAGGFPPFFEMKDLISGGLPLPNMMWVDRGVLTNLAYSVGYGLSKGKPYGTGPASVRLDVVPETPTLSVEEMIASCDDGIYVNRFSDLQPVDSVSGMVTGVTRGGCFLIKDGRIAKPVKNFRILDSPFFFLNNLESVGVTRRVATGFARYGSWPLPPVIAPPITVRDFNFVALSDAV